MIRARVDQARLAVMLLTRLPVGRLRDPAPTISASVWAFPLAGLLVGALAAAVLFAALATGLSPALAAGLALAAQILATGALHEDGLADLADGIWGGRNIERRLEIMRDSRIGSYGALALILSVGLRWQALTVIASGGTWATTLALVAVAMTSRVAPAFLLAFLPPARTDGMGHVARGATMAAVFTALAIALVPAVFLPSPLTVLAIQALAALSVARLAQTRLGGQTGDVLGAAQQLAEIGGLLALSALSAA